MGEDLIAPLTHKSHCSQLFLQYSVELSILVKGPDLSAHGTLLMNAFVRAFSAEDSITLYALHRFDHHIHTDPTLEFFLPYDR